MKSYIAAKYPGLKIVTTGYGQSVESVSFSVAEGIIHAYPAIKAIIPIDSAAIPGTAKAISDLGKSGKIGVSASAPEGGPDLLRQRRPAGAVPLGRGRPGQAGHAHGQARLRGCPRGT